jgi:hypothetical protein
MRMPAVLRSITGPRSSKGEARLPHPQAADLGIEGYDDLSEDDVAQRLRSSSQQELRAIETYEHKRRDRPAIVNRVASLIEDEPWDDYDRASTEAIVASLDQRGLPDARRVKAYERAHKARPAVLQSVNRRIERS